MKKTVYGIFAALTLVFAFAACDDDSSDIDRGTHAQLPEEALAGDYDGSYTIISEKGDTTGTVEATVTFAAGDSTYTAVFSSVCPTNSDLNGTEMNVLNVTWANDDIMFCYASNSSNTGSLNATDLNGIRYADGTLSLKFKLTKRVGRVTTNTFYQFTGNR